MICGSTLLSRSKSSGDRFYGKGKIRMGSLMEYFILTVNVNVCKGVFLSQSVASKSAPHVNSKFTVSLHGNLQMARLLYKINDRGNCYRITDNCCLFLPADYTYLYFKLL